MTQIDLLHDQKEDEPGRCRMRVQLNIACRDGGRSDVRSGPSPHPYRYHPRDAFCELNILKVNKRGGLKNIHSTTNEFSIFDSLFFFSTFYGHFHALVWGLNRKEESCVVCVET